MSYERGRRGGGKINTFGKHGERKTPCEFSPKAAGNPPGTPPGAGCGPSSDYAPATATAFHLTHRPAITTARHTPSPTTSRRDLARRRSTRLSVCGSARTCPNQGRPRFLRRTVAEHAALRLPRCHAPTPPPPSCSPALPTHPRSASHSPPLRLAHSLETIHAVRNHPRAHFPQGRRDARG